MSTGAAFYHVDSLGAAELQQLWRLAKHSSQLWSGLKVLSHEDCAAWQHETPGLYEGAARYRDRMLRMVSPLNLL